MGGGGSGKIFAGPQFYCDFWNIKPRSDIWNIGEQGVTFYSVLV